MPQDGNSRGIISDEQLAGLCALFVRFEGPLDPFSKEVKEAKAEFDRLVSKLYAEVVYPKFGDSVTSITFSGLLLAECRKRVAKSPPRL
jgi:hypothetical protein